MNDLNILQPERSNSNLGISDSVPTIALLHYYDVIDDFLESIHLTFDEFCTTFVGSWMFGYADALKQVGVRTVLFCITTSVTHPTRFIHKPSGTKICALPPSTLYRELRQLRRFNSKRYKTKLQDINSSFNKAPGISPFLSFRSIMRSVGTYLSTPLELLAQELKQECCQAILCQEYEFARFDSCVSLGKRLGLPVFATFQGGNETLSFIERPFRSSSIHHCNGLIIASQAEVERVSRQYKLPACKISRIFNPLDITRWKPLDRQSCRRILNLPENAHIVVWHGRVEIYSKGLDLLLEAWRLLCKTRASDDLRLLMVGTGGDAKKLQGLIDSLEISSILWVNEFISDQARMVQYLCAADVFTLPSRREGFPIAPLEAMCCGLPIVVADAPGVNEILEDGEESGGIVVPLNDANALAIALSRVLDNENLRQTLGQRGRRRATQYFAPKVIGEQLRNVLLNQSKENSSSDANQ